MNDISDVVEAFDGAVAFGGPLHGSAESAEALALTLQEWGLGGPYEAPRRQRSRKYDEVASRGWSSLVQPVGTLHPGRQKFVCRFLIGLEDDNVFCLVKRILGKAGGNMRRIADDCNAKVRLRGIGSGFLEGMEATEAPMPLSLHISCFDYLDYVVAVEQVGSLLKNLYKHYRRFARSMQMEPPDVKLHVEELRRDDLNLNLLQSKAAEFIEPANGARIPLGRRWQTVPRAKAAALPQDLMNLVEPVERPKADDEEGSSETKLDADDNSNNEVFQQQKPAFDSNGFTSTLAVKVDESRTLKTHQFVSAFASVDDAWRAPTLPSGAPMPTTPAGRRAAARQGGAEAAAIASAAAYAALRVECEQRRQKTAHYNKLHQAKIAAGRRKSAPRGIGLIQRFGGDVQQLLPDGQVPIGAHGAQELVSSKGIGKGKWPRKRGGKRKRGEQKDKPVADGDGPGSLRHELDLSVDSGHLEMPTPGWPARAISSAIWTPSSSSERGEHVELPSDEEHEALGQADCPWPGTPDSKPPVSFGVE